MSKIEQLIEQLCPEGVEYKKLGEVCEIKRGTVYSKKYISEHSGSYPLYSSQTMNNGELGRISTYDYEGDYLTWTTDGAYAGTIFHRKGRFSITNVCGIIQINPVILNIRFLYHWLSIVAKDYVYAGMGNPKLMSNQMAKVTIPLPPLPVQQEIVRILDAFTELEAELEARKKQYAYYRDTLLSFEHDDPEVEWKKLGEVGTFTRGNGLQKKDFIESGVGCIHYGQIYTRYGTATDKTISYCSPELAKRLKKARKGDLIIATTSENVEDVCKAVVWLGEEEIAVSGDACIFSHNQNPKYIGYWYQSQAFFEQKKRKATGTKVIRVSKEAMADFLIPLPPLPVQQEIVRILDKFEALTTDLQSGLPAEIEARKKQYEYYRDRLLTFKVKN